MCITSTARRRGLNIQVLPSHLLSIKEGESALATQPISTSVPQKNEFYFRPEEQSFRSEYGSISPDDPTHLEPSSHQVVQHNYHDHSTDPVVDPTQIKHKAKGGVITPFPVKLHDMLDQIERDGLSHVVSWQPHGRCFVVHKPKEFVNYVMPKYFKQTKMASFQRQLNLYGFNRLTGGLDKGGYYHELFLRGKVSLAYDIHRMRVKGTGVRLPTNPDNEPNFYALAPVTKSRTTTAVASSVELSSQVVAATMPETKVEEKIATTSTLFQRAAEMRLESYDHSRKIQPGATTSALKRDDEDVVFFEGCPFHYLDPRALAPVCPPADKSIPQLPNASSSQFTINRPNLVHSTSTVVSDSEEDCEVPSFSVADMDWEGPLSSPSLQAHMRRSSFQSFVAKDAMTERRLPWEEDIESFFQGFSMPVDRYHEQIEQMCEDDDTAFGYLLEQAISE